MGSGVSVVQPCTKRSDMVLQAEEGDDVKTCCVCLEVLQFDSSSFFRATCCGQGIHRECFHELLNSTMPIQLKASCPYCRRFYPLTNSSVEQFKNCKFWALKEKSWAQTLLGKMFCTWHSPTHPPAHPPTHPPTHPPHRIIILLSLHEKQ